MTTHVIGPKASIFHDAESQVEYSSILVKPIPGVVKTFGEVVSAYGRVLDQLGMVTSAIIHQHDPYLCLTGEDNVPWLAGMFSGVVLSDACKHADQRQWTMIVSIVTNPPLEDEMLINLSEHAGNDFRLVLPSAIADDGNVSVEADGEPELLVGTMTDDSTHEGTGI